MHEKIKGHGPHLRRIEAVCASFEATCCTANCTIQLVAASDSHSYWKVDQLRQQVKRSHGWILHVCQDSEDRARDF